MFHVLKNWFISFSPRKSNKTKKVAIIRKDENLLQQASKYYNISLVSITCIATDEIILSFCIFIQKLKINLVKIFHHCNIVFFLKGVCPLSTPKQTLLCCQKHPIRISTPPYYEG